MRKRHDQYCPIARTLDLIGDRWSLLILREFLFGDQRFVDLREHLPGISPMLLTERLQMLAEQGLVATKELPPPAARTVYTTTAKVREARPILRAMARFGLELLPPPRASTKVRPETAVYGAVESWYDGTRRRTSTRSTAWSSTPPNSPWRAPARGDARRRTGHRCGNREPQQTSAATLPADLSPALREVTHGS